MKELIKLIETKKTVFTIEDIAKFTNFSSAYGVRNFVSNLAKKGFLHNIYYGIRALKEYDPYELACKLQKNAYISLETVLQKEGIIFQDYTGQISCISNNTRHKEADGIQFYYHKIQDPILYNPTGILHKHHYQIATVERALCDMTYLSGKVSHYDNIEWIDSTKLEEIITIYPDNTQNLFQELLSYVRSKHA